MANVEHPPSKGPRCGGANREGEQKLQSRECRDASKFSLGLDTQPEPVVRCEPLESSGGNAHFNIVFVIPEPVCEHQVSIMSTLCSICYVHKV